MAPEPYDVKMDDSATEPYNALEALHNGWKEYRRKIKGWSSTPRLVDIADWEQYKQLVFAGLDAKEEQN